MAADGAAGAEDGDDAGLGLAHGEGGDGFDDADDGDGEGVAHGVFAVCGGGVAGEDEGLDALGGEEVGAAERVAAHGVGAFVAVGDAGGVAEVDEALTGQGGAQRAQDGEAADAAVKDADGEGGGRGGGRGGGERGGLGVIGGGCCHGMMGSWVGGRAAAARVRGEGTRAGLKVMGREGGQGMRTPERLLHLIALGDKDAARELLREARRRGDVEAQGVALRVIAPGLRADAQVCDGDLEVCDADITAFARLEVVTGDLALQLNDPAHLGALSSLRVVMGTLSLRGSAASGALSLPALVEVGGLLVEGNGALEEVTLPQLRVAHRDITVRDNPALRALRVAQVFTVGGQLTATGPALTDIPTPTPDPAADARAQGLHAEETQRLLDSFQEAAAAMARVDTLDARRRKSALTQWAWSAVMGVIIGLTGSALIGHCSPPSQSWRDIPYPQIKIPPVDIPPLRMDLEPLRALQQMQMPDTLRVHVQRDQGLRGVPRLTALRVTLKALSLLTVRVNICNNLGGMSPLQGVLCRSNAEDCCNTTQAPFTLYPEGHDAHSQPD